MARAAWMMFQMLIGNTDAHAKNISFFSATDGFRATPSYDLVSTLAFETAKIDNAFAMAIGDAFVEQELSATAWANFAVSCGLRPQLVAQEMKKMIVKIHARLDATSAEVQVAGADAAVVQRVCEVVRRMCARHGELAAKIATVERDLL